MALQLCRICGSRDGLLNVLEHGPTMLDKLSKCANIEISPADILPKHICQQCDRMLDMSYQLRKQSESMQEKLQQELQQKQDAEVHYISDDDGKSEIEFKREQVASSHTRQEYVSLEALEAVDAKTESTLLASETGDVEESAVHPLSSNSADDIDSNESFGLSAAPTFKKKVVTDEDELVDIGDMNAEVTYDSMKSGMGNVYRSIVDFCSVGLLSNPASPLVDIEHEESKTDSRSSSSLFTCDICNGTFTLKKDYQEHLKQHGLDRYQCVQCLARFPTRYRLNRHEQIHTGIVRYNCCYCSRVYTAHSNLQRHINACHSKEESFECDICKVAFARQDVLRRHVQQVHCKKWHCKNCGESFRSAYFLSLHKTMANCYEEPEPPTSITVKPNGLLSYPLPSEYIVKASNDRYKCIHCSVLFKTLYTYRNHLLIHQNVRPFPCSTCPKAFRTRYALVNHERIHSNERPFKCDICSKSFRQVTHLKHHRYQHTKDEMPFHCRKCQMRFVTKWKLRDHLRRFCAEKAFKCAECPEEFFLKYDLKRHARSVHYRSVDIGDSDNEGNQKNEMDFTEGTTETDKTDDDRITENEFYDNSKDDAVDILDEADMQGVDGESSNSIHDNVFVLNEAEPASLEGEDANSYPSNFGMTPDFKKCKISFQTPLPANLPQVQFMNFNDAKMEPETASNTDVASNANQNETILDYIDLEEETKPEPETLNEPFIEEIPKAESVVNIIDVINLDDDDNDEELRLASPQTSNVLVMNEPILDYMNYMPDPAKPVVLSSMLLNSADDEPDAATSNPPKVEKENVIDFIHIDSSNSCKSPPRNFYNENGYYENAYEENEQNGEYDTIIEEKIQITEEKIETFTSFYNIEDVA